MIHALYFFAMRLRYVLCTALCLGILFSCSLSGSDGGTSSAGADGSSSGSSPTGTNPTASSPGSIDTTFGTEGKVITSFGTGDDAINALALQEDGKIIAVGYAAQNNKYVFALARYNPDGSLDTSFGIDGKVTTSIGNIADTASGVALQSDGKILVAGTTGGGTTASDFALVRYTKDGSLDTTFGTEGIVTTQIGISANAYGICIQQNEKIILIGYAYSGSPTFALARYDKNGTLDASFGTDGKVIIKIGDYSLANGVAIQSDGKIVLAGMQKRNNYTDFTVVRYNSEGSLDNTFGNGGVVLTPISDCNDSAKCVTILPNGKILVGGCSYTGQSSSDFALVRYNQDGSLDHSFGQEGKVITDISGMDEAHKIAIQSDGKIILVGFASGTASALARYNPDGTLDTTFGTGGKVTTYGEGSANDVVITPDGSIVVGGYVTSYQTQRDFALVRYKP